MSITSLTGFSEYLLLTLQNTFSPHHPSIDRVIIYTDNLT